ncbi:tryptase-2-like [Aulostomus maculatus]
MAFSILLAVLALVHNAAGVLGAEVRSSIVGGKDAAKGSWPWMVHLNLTDGTNNWRCGGSILNTEWVLSAASCWKRHPVPDLNKCMAWVGTHTLQGPSERYLGIVYAMSHEHFRAMGSGFVNDITLVKLKKKLRETKLVQRVALASVEDTFDSSSECWITGWGSVGNGLPLKSPETLQELKIPLVSQDTCQAVYSEVTSDMLCAGDTAGGKDACTGDYGGPLVCRSGPGFVQVGIMSYGSSAGCAMPGYPGVYTRVSKYLGFIHRYVHNLEDASVEV